MVECLTRISKQMKKSDVLIFFTDGGSTDGNPNGIANQIKGSGTRIITIGCGGSVNEKTLRSMASSQSDYHSAKNAKMIIDAFQAVAKSLKQTKITKSSKMKKSSPKKTARQIRSGPDVKVTNSGTTTKFNF